MMGSAGNRQLQRLGRGAAVFVPAGHALVWIAQEDRVAIWPRRERMAEAHRRPWHASRSRYSRANQRRVDFWDINRQMLLPEPHPAPDMSPIWTPAQQTRHLDILYARRLGYRIFIWQAARWYRCGGTE